MTLFPIILLFYYSLTMPEEHYREAAAILVLRSSTASRKAWELLLIHKPRKRDAWQLPQGGMEERETVEQCAVRELSEEAGLTQVTVVGASPRVYAYDFPASFRRFRPDSVKGQRIRFVFATAFPEAEVTVDGVEVDDAVWIPVSALSQYISRKEYRSLVEELYREAQPLLPHAS